jgi:hypothetical protein
MASNLSEKYHLTNDRVNENYINEMINKKIKQYSETGKYENI